MKAPCGALFLFFVRCSIAFKMEKIAPNKGIPKEARFQSHAFKATLLKLRF